MVRSLFKETTMKRILNRMTAACLRGFAILAVCGLTVFTACTSDNDDNPTPGVTTAELVGRWTADVTGATATLWGDGKAMQTTELKSDGTGSTDMYYLLNEDIAIARSHQTFRYTATADGLLTMTMDGSQQTATATWSVADGRLTLQTDGQPLTLQKADAVTERRIAEWNADDDLLDVPAPARYTVFVYGNAGGDMDNIIEEGLWERLKPLLTDQSNVRVVCFYKYGEETNSKYGYDGDIVWFELNSETNLDKLREEGLQALGLEQEAKDMKLCDPATLQMFMRWSSLLCPAENYVFTIWGHGSGFEATHDIPGKYYTAEARATRGVIGDEWNDDEQLDMYELAYAIRTVSQRPFDNIYFHNCLMGNLETITELRDVADYITCSAHVLCSDGKILVEYIRGLMDKGNTPEAIDQMFSRAGDEWKQTYLEESLQESPYPYNGDMKLLRTDCVAPLLAATKRLADRLVAQYPTQKEAIDRATCRVYRFETPPIFTAFYAPFFDLADYAHKVAEETGDAEFATIAAAINAAFSDAFVHYRDVNWNEEQFLPHYTLSVCLVNRDTYTRDFMNDDFLETPRCNFNEGYEQTFFHRSTGWGTWLNANLQLPYGNPTSGGGSEDDDSGDFDDFE